MIELVFQIVMTGSPPKPRMVAPVQFETVQQCRDLAHTVLSGLVQNGTIEIPKAGLILAPAWERRLSWRWLGRAAIEYDCITIGGVSV
jgi:hypothetical protein